MNTFALNIFDDEGSLCTFYTVTWYDDDDSQISETEKFFNKYNENTQLKISLQELATFIFEKIANETGALEDFFRFENIAQGLPPSGIHVVQETPVNYIDFPLRLYCLRINDSLVVLFNGGEKTSTNAQGGKTSMVFAEANMFAKRILEALRSQEIIITPNQREFKSYTGTSDILL